MLVFNLLLLCSLAAAVAIPSEPIDLLALDKRAPEGIVVADLGLNDNFQYSMAVKVGSEGKLFNPVADTGSVITWFPNDDDWADKSTTLINTTETFSVGYVNVKPVLGYYVNDTLALADGETKGFKFGVVDSPRANRQGIVGLARKSYTYVPLPVYMHDSGTIDDAVTSITFSSKQNKGKLVFGGYDQAKVGSAWSVHPDPKQFKVPITNVTVNGTTFTPQGKDAEPIVVDTGASGSYIPRLIIEQIASAYKNPRNASHRYYVSCDLPEGLFKLGLGDLVLDIPYKDFVSKHADDATTCLLGAAASEDSNNLHLIGGAILQHVVSVFDYTKGEVRIANYVDADHEDFVKF